MIFLRKLIFLKELDVGMVVYGVSGESRNDGAAMLSISRCRCLKQQLN